MKMWKLASCILAAVVLVIVASCGPTDTRIRVVFVSNGVADFWTLAQRGVEKAGEDLDLIAEMQMPSGGITHQKEMMEDLLIRGVQGMAVSPIDPVNQTEFLNEVAGRTRLVTVDSDAPDSERLVYVGMDNYRAGRMCGELVEEALPDGGSLMIFIGRMEQDNAKRRRQGLIDEILGREYNPDNHDEPGKTLSGNGYTILGTLTDQFDRVKAKANVEDTLSRHPDIKGMVGLFAYNPPLILEALRQADKLGEVQVIGFDENDGTLQGIIDGSVHGTVVQDPYNYGYRSIEVLASIIRGDESVIPEGGFIDIPAQQIRKDNVEAFWTDLKAKIDGEVQ